MSTRRHEPERFYVPTDTSGTLDGSRIGLAWLVRQGSTYEGEPLVVVPSARSANENTHVRAATTSYRWLTWHTYRGAPDQGWQSGPTLLLFPNAAVLDWFDRSPRVPALCVVQGALHDTTPWARAYGPEDLTTGRPYPNEPGIDPVVERALLWLQRSVHWRGLTTAEDISLAVRTMRLLRDRGHPFTSQDLEAWALSKGWRPDLARRLAAYATRVSDGSRIMLRARTRPPPGAIARWRKGAQAPPPDVGATMGGDAAADR